MKLTEKQAIEVVKQFESEALESLTKLYGDNCYWKDSYLSGAFRELLTQALYQHPGFLRRVEQKLAAAGSHLTDLANDSSNAGGGFSNNVQ